MKKKYTLLCLLLVATRFVLAQNPLSSFNCGTPDVSPTPAIQQLMNSLNRDTTYARARMKAQQKLECRVAVDADYKLYQAYNGDVSAIRRLVYERIREASEVFERNINVKLTVVYIHVWDKQEPYVAATTDSHLSSMAAWWRQNLQNVKRDIVFGYTGKQSGASGVAYRGQTRLSDFGVAGYVQPGSYYTTHLSAHEIGHMFGSAHLNDCSWPGGPLDSCNVSEGGNCYTGVPVTRKNYTMGSCGYPILEFHPVSNELMRRLADASGLVPIDKAPSLPTVSNQAVNVTKSFAYVEWQPGERSERFRIQVSENADFSTIATDSLVLFSQFRAYNLKANTAYYWRVKAVNSLGESNWSVVGRLNVGTISGIMPPVQKLPVHLAKNVRQGLLSWEPVEGATSYKIEVANVYGIRSLTSTQTSFTFTDGTPSGYGASWRVKAVKGTEEGSWSDYNAYKVGPNAYFSLTTLETSQKKYPLSLPVSWGNEPTVSSSATMTLRLYKSSAPQAPVQSQTLRYNHPDDGGLVTYPVVMFNNLEPNTTYYYDAELMDNDSSRVVIPKASTFETGANRNRWTFINGANSTLPRSEVQVIRGGPSGTVWVATTNGVYSTADGRTWAAHTPKTTNGVLPNYITVMALDNNERPWVQHYTGLYQFINNKWQKFANPPAASQMSAKHLVFDKKNLLYAVQNNTNQIYSFNGSQWAALPTTGTTISSVAVDKDNRLWVASGANQQFIGYYDGAKWNWLSRSNVGFSNLIDYYASFTQITADSTGNLWVYGDFGVARQKADQTWEATTLLDITKDQNEIITNGFAIGPNNQPTLFGLRRVYKYANNRWEPTGDPTVIVNDYQRATAYVGADSRVWLANQRQGIMIYDSRTVTPTMNSLTTCAGNTMQVPFTLNFTPGTTIRYRAEISTVTGFTSIAATFQNSTATIQLPASLTPGTNYRVRIVAEQAKAVIIGDESAPFTIIDSKNVTVSPSGPAAVCTGSILNLSTPSASGATYQWLKDGQPIVGATQAVYGVSQAGSYVVAVSQSGCSASSAAIVVTMKEGVTATITAQGQTTALQPNTVSLAANTGNGYTYQWLKDGSSITGATNSTYAAAQTGNFAVVVTGPNGCTATSTPIAVRIDIVLGVESVDNTFLLMPNPVDKICRIQKPAYATFKSNTVAIKLINSAGQVVKSQNLTFRNSVAELDMESTLSGLYILEIEVDGNSQRYKLVKQ
ncbi:hypothetical protein GCM10028806_29400 [Spirosoma terrae]|uniref:T9SS type A sorting domain-containing protein n=1 Tax=Spirosoma terrae TaxID=1968276 RepID=A0A6L9LES2_9BACT|nr:M12 family metallo-peptidase [Spirosoma terrae]NDU99066.1 T9SS type A sorting domain-containing protein [Spirosoma terrae]